MYGFSWLIEGKLAGMAHPGSVFLSGLQAGDTRLQEDLRVLEEDGVGAVVSLTESPLDEGVVRTSGLDYLHLPIRDMTAPTPADIGRFVDFVKVSVRAGRAVVVHCAAGKGRTGTILACYLVSEGHDPEVAISRVRRARPGSIETEEQEEAVHAYARHLRRARP